MDIAIITGAETALGIRLVERLIRQGCRVHGIGNNFSAVEYHHNQFIAHAVDLTDVQGTSEVVEGILQKEGAVHIVIHAIDVAPGNDFHQLAIGNLEAVLKVGLVGPVLLTRLVLPNLVRFRGQLIFVVPSGKTGFAPNATTGLIEDGIRRLAAELLLSHRDAGLRVSTVLLRQNTEAPALGAAKAATAQTRIDPDHAAAAIERIIAEGEPNILGELVLYPRTSPAAEPLPTVPVPLDPYREVSLPPKEKRAVEPEPIPTQAALPRPANFAISDEELEDRIAEAMEEYALHPERYHEQTEVPRARPPRAAERVEPDHPKAASGAPEGDSTGGGKKRRSRNRNRNRRRNRDRESTGEEANAKNPEGQNRVQNTQPEPAPKPNRAPEPANVEKAFTEPGKEHGEAKERGERSGRSRRGRKRSSPRPAPDETGNHGPSAAHKPEVKAPAAADKRPPAAEEPGSSSASPAAAKRTAKKKTTRKADQASPAVVKKKAATKKVARKTVKKAVKKKPAKAPESE